MDRVERLLTKALPSLWLGEPLRPTPAGPWQDGWSMGLLLKSILSAHRYQAEVTPLLYLAQQPAD